MKKTLPLFASAMLTGLSFCADFSVQTANGVPRIVKDGEPFPQRLYMGNPIHLPTVKMACDAGVSICQIVDYNLVWDGMPESAFAEFDAVMDRLLAVDPRVKVIPRIKLDDRMPPCLKKHPECLMRLEDGKTVSGYDPRTLIGSIASPLYREEIRKALRRTIRHLEKKYGDRMAGYHPSYGQGSEWQYWKFAQANSFNGYDPSTLAAFQTWLKKKYGTDEKLARAWRKGAVTFKTVKVPSSAERRGKPGAMFHDPATAQNVIDFNLFQNDLMADALLESARVIREECGKKRLSCFYYGYTFECSVVWNSGPAETGHFALRKVLDSPDVDVLIGPFSYAIPSRALSGGAATHTASESVTAAGKVWLNEDDNGTHLAVPDYLKTGQRPDSTTHSLRTLGETLKIYRRDLAVNYLRNHAGWWMDLWGKGWQNEPRLWKEMERFLPLEQKLFAAPQPFEPEIGLFIDEESILYLTSSRNHFWQTRFACHMIRNMASLSSVPCGQYLLSDVLRGKAARTKLDIYCNPAALTEKERRILRERSAKRASIWLWAPGYIDKEKQQFSLETMKELTGFTFKEMKTSYLTVRATGEGMMLGMPFEFGSYTTTRPNFAIAKAEKGDIVLGHFMDGSIAILYRPARNGRAPSLFCGGQTIPPALIRFMAKQAKAHVWSEDDLHVVAQRDTAAVTAPRNGAYAITTPWQGKIRDMLTGKIVGDKGRVLCEMKLGDTMILEKAE